MLTFLAVLHVVIGLSLILFVLLQDPKGSAMGAFGAGASSNTFFGSSGASNFLTSVTKWTAVAFAVSCLVLTYITSHKSGSVMDEVVSPAAPAESATPPATAPVTTPAPETAPQTK